MLIKICGLSNLIDAQEAVCCGATALGFVMGGKCLPVEVEPHAQTVKEIIRTIGTNIDTYIVTHLLNAEDILALADYVGSSGIQISEELDVSIVRDVRQRTDKKIIKTVIVKDESSIDILKSYEPYADYILLDTMSAGYVGGTGKTSDWNLCKKLVCASKKPVFLAGGLTPENVSLGINKVNPAGVDVATGVSTYSESYLRKDRKCPLKIKNFIQNSLHSFSNSIPGSKYDSL
jgi:phosphoribosylanthranilate isomerase